MLVAEARPDYVSPMLMTLQQKPRWVDLSSHCRLERLKIDVAATAVVVVIDELVVVRVLMDRSLYHFED